MKLMVEVLDHSPAGLTATDRLLLIVVAENVSDTTREGWPGWELIARRMQWSGNKDGGRNAVSTALAAMAKRGVDLRVPFGKDKNGKPVYAANGRRTTYRVPDLRRVAESTTLEGCQPVPPLPAEGWQSEGLKGGNLKGPRVAESATPSPQEPSKNPQASRATDDLPTYGEDPEALPDSLRTIRLSLLHTHPDSTLDEAHAVHSLIIAKHHPKSITYYRKIAGGDGFGGYLAEVRAAAAEQRRRDLEEQLRTAPPCDHGQPGGQTIRTPDGQPSCALCRRGMPADQATTGTDPARADMVSAYRDVAIAAGRNPDAHELITITQLAGLALRLGDPTGEAA